jgi:endonuclease/exonuclease/phosphatase family metal-dependent hydrolase
VKRERKRFANETDGQNGGNMKIGTLKALSQAVSAPWVWVFALSVLAVGICPSLAMGDDGDHRSIQVVTYNLDEGTDYNEVIAALLSGDFKAFQQAVLLTINNVKATNPPDRMATIAQEIGDKGPDLVSVQEATQWRIANCKDSDSPAIDILQLLLNDLAAQGQNYNAVVTVKEFDVSGVTPDFTCIRATNQDAILARGDVQISNVQSGHYQNLLSFNTKLRKVTIVRGWGAVDVTVGNKSFRCVGTHLEGNSAPIQIAQGNELLQGPANTNIPVILAGDFNSVANNPNDPTYPTYREIVNAGLVDIWPVANPGDPGLTCCQDPLLLNVDSQLSQRIDLIFANGGLRVREAELIGDESDDKTSTGLWPSDHAGGVGKLKLSH